MVSRQKEKCFFLLKRRIYISAFLYTGSHSIKMFNQKNTSVFFIPFFIECETSELSISEINKIISNMFVTLMLLYPSSSSSN